MELPTADTSASLARARHPLTEMEAEEARPGVLIVDDDPQVRDSLADALRQLGFRVVGALGDGEAAVAAAEVSAADVILMDVRMPGLDGIEAVRRVKELPFAPEIVMLTAHGDLELREQAEAAGACAYLPKDCSVSALRDEIWGALLHRSTPFIDGASPGWTDRGEAPGPVPPPG